MLEEVLRYINNRFDRDTSGAYYGVDEGSFQIQDGAIESDVLAEGAYYWIEGSSLNDGLHLHPADDLRDESFEGKVTALHIPSAVVGIADEAEAWCSANAETISSPLQSESFGGYSYSRASGGASGNEMPSTAWQLQYGARLRPYKKLSRDWV